MASLHRRYEIHPRWDGDRWELHISGVGMITTIDLTRAPSLARAYIDADLGPGALDGAEIVLLDTWPPAHTNGIGAPRH